MSSAICKLDIASLRKQLEDLRENFVHLVADGLEKMAVKAIDQRYQGGVKEAAGPYGDTGALYGRLDKLNSRLIPVTLKNVRPERWPDIEAVVKRRGVGKTRYFYVDRVKLAAFHRKQLSKRLARLGGAGWSIRVKIDGDYFVEVSIIKNGAMTKADRYAADALEAAMWRIFSDNASGIIRDAIRDAGAGYTKPKMSFRQWKAQMRARR